MAADYPALDAIEADAEPDQRTGVCGCGHYASQHGLGWKACGFCWCGRYAEPSRAEGEES